ncbi:threonine/homoserine/homoserine lactone efflux protein [Gillisia sp. Hel_I_86]|uniref:LysE family translocator n=1 Tax=Gillisia sp. Hel_I_86 TaxID=1249981 RepID=UPI00119C6218|nr:LysE family transporter [Gillisia sp. Hel_I_86]TVZ25896.1 threonine/homoserine/homoserine lactone efflux protein [Gillisia sp. Hel_I_86]
MEETKIFLITYFAALLGVVPPGLVNMTVAKTCVEYGKRNGIYVAIGASIIVFFQALIAVFLAKYIFDNPFVRNILLRTGLVIFIVLMIYFYMKARSDSHMKKHSKKANSNSIFKGMLVAVLNVFPIPFFVAIAAALNVGGGVSYDWSVMLFFVLAATLGTFTTLYFYIFSFWKIEDKSVVFAKYSNYFMAALMLVLVIITLIRIFYY